MRKSHLAIVIALVLASGLTVVALALGNWSAARSKAEDFLKANAELRKLTPYETRRIVTAVCEAEEDEREAVGQEMAKRAKDKVNKDTPSSRPSQANPCGSWTRSWPTAPWPSTTRTPGHTRRISPGTGSASPG